MSISKFSKGNVTFIFPTWEDIKILSKKSLIESEEYIPKLFDRLLKLGYTHANMLGTLSYTSEYRETIAQLFPQSSYFNTLPLTERNLLLRHILHSSDDIEEMDIKQLVNPYSEKLTKIENSISQLLKNELTLSNILPEEQKVNTILSILALTYFRQPLNQQTIDDSDDMVHAFLFSVKKELEEVKGYILADLENQWKLAQEKLSTSRLENYGIVAKDFMTEEDLYEKQSNEVTDVLQFLSQGERNKHSEINFNVNYDSIDRSYNDMVVEDNPTDTLYNLLQTNNMSEILSSNTLTEQLEELISLIEKFESTSFRETLENSNFIVDFYVSKSSKPHSFIQYKSSNNRIILSIDLKSGNVDCFFKGQSFKLNNFFMEGEEVKTNIKEW